MRPRRLRLATLLGLSLLLGAMIAPATTAAASTSGASTTNEACSTQWPASVQGRPTLLTSGGPAGDYIWHNSTGWHLRVTHASSSRVVFTGRITASAALTVMPARLEDGDWVALSADRHTIVYRFVNFGNVDGLNFTTACASRVTFSGSRAGSKLPIGRIWIGHNNRHPLQNPFSVYRVH
ncbi:MAG: hypothetical protein H0U58_07790 [Chloroflexi bacterium]|nr:hypothetical protein [Chloroflexota bacterium]